MTQPSIMSGLPDVGLVQQDAPCQVEKVRVEFDREDAAGVIRHPGGQAAGAGADLENAILLGQFAGAGDEIDQVQVDEEVLPHFVLGDQTARLQHPLDVREGLTLGGGNLIH